MAAAPKKVADAKKATDAKKTDAGDEATEVVATGSKKKLFLFIGLALFLVIISVGGTVAALKLLAPSGDEEETDEEEEVVEEVVPLAPAIYFQMTPNFTINFNVNGRQRFLQAEITLMYRDPILEPVLKLHMPAIRNGLVMLLSNKNFDDLQTPEGKELLKKEAFDTVQGILVKEQQAALPKPEDDEEEAEEDEEDTKKDKKKKNKKVKEKEQPKVPGIEQVLFTNFVMQ
jgi:flagellar FliL protein